MKPAIFLESLRKLHFENAFNPYSDRCAVHDLEDAPRARSRMLLSLLEMAAEREVDSLWIGRDLGHRGGRRTGLAFTDDVNVQAHTERWGLTMQRPTKGEAVTERTAAVVWRVLSQVRASVFLWNVFPLHPHDPGSPFSNRSHNSRERRAGEEFLSQLVAFLRPSRLVAIGNDAAQTARRLFDQHRIIQVRHPSYGGQIRFLTQMNELYPGIGLSRVTTRNV